MDVYSLRDQFVSIFAVSILCLGIPIYCLYSQGILAIFNHFAADAFYYLAIATHSTTGFYSYNGTNAVNSFHPLWGWGLTALFNIVGTDQSVQLLSVFLINVITVTIGCLLAAFSVYRVTKSALLSILVFPGIYGLLLGTVSNDHTAYWLFLPPWSFINGMESGLTVLFGGTFLYYAASWSQFDDDVMILQTKPVFVLGILTALLVMSRLDDIFLVIAFMGLFWLLPVALIQQRVRYAAVFCAPTVVVLLLYLLFNYLTVGAAFPISGISKAGFALPSNLEWFVSTFVPGGIELFGWTSDAQVGQHLTEWPLRSWRMFQIVVPAVLAGSFLVIIATTREYDRLEFIQVGLLVYVLLKAAYNFTCVRLMHQGWWYYPLSIMIVNVVGLQLFGRAYSSFIQISKWRSVSVAILIVICLGGASTKYVFFKTNTIQHAHIQGQCPNEFYEFWRARNQIRRALLKENEGKPVKIVEFDDGIVAYALGFPTVNAVHSMDLETYRASEQGQLLTHLQSRGYNTLGSLYYLQRYLGGGTTPRERIESRARSRFGLGFDVTLIYRHPATDALFLRFNEKIRATKKNP